MMKEEGDLAKTLGLLTNIIQLAIWSFFAVVGILEYLSILSLEGMLDIVFRTDVKPDQFENPLHRIPEPTRWVGFLVSLLIVSHILVHTANHLFAKVQMLDARSSVALSIEFTAALSFIYSVFLIVIIDIIVSLFFPAVSPVEFGLQPAPETLRYEAWSTISFLWRFEDSPFLIGIFLLLYIAVLVLHTIQGLRVGAFDDIEDEPLVLLPAVLYPLVYSMIIYALISILLELLAMLMSPWQFSLCAKKSAAFSCGFGLLPLIVSIIIFAIYLVWTPYRLSSIYPKVEGVSLFDKDKRRISKFRLLILLTIFLLTSITLL